MARNVGDLTDIASFVEACREHLQGGVDTNCQATCTSDSLELRGMSKVERLEAAREKLKLVGLEEWTLRFPGELSGGMKQRVGLARAMAADPEILLMDEPFSALDPLIRRQLQQQFLELAKLVKKTTVFITHDLDEAIRLGDHIAIMKDGKFVQVGTPEEIVTEPADDYVADFVKGISRLDLVTARKIMRPLLGGVSRANGATMPANAMIGTIIELAAQHDGDITVLDADMPVGTISCKDLLLGIKG